MNKSKFLKKSLAMILAVMMVVAMIPLSASAAWVQDGDVVSIAVDQGTLEGSGKEFTNTLAYDVCSDVTVTVTLKDSSDYVNFTVYDADGEEDTNAAVSGKAVTVDYTSSKVVFNVTSEDYDEDEETGTKSADYTINFTQKEAVADTSIKTAVLNKGGSIEVKGVVDNTKKTITFTVPWGYSEISDANKDKITYTLNNPVDSANPEISTETVDFEESKKVSVEAQNGSTKTYTVTVNEMDCLTSVSVAGVAATQDVDADGELVPGEYTVYLPADTDFTKAVAVKYTVAQNSGVSVAESKFGVKNGTATKFRNGASKYIDDTTITVANDGVYELTLTSNKDTEKTYKITVETVKSDDATIEAFVVAGTADSTEYRENGTVKGDKLSVVMPYETDLTTLKVTFTVADGATVEVNGAAFTNDGTSTINLKDKTATVEVIAEDGEHNEYYELSATAAEKVTGAPTISAAKMTLGAVEYSATISGKVITFSNIPYATTAAKVRTAANNMSWAKSFATVVGAISWNADTDEDIFSGTNTVTITSDNGEKTTYTIKFVKAAAKTGKTISDFTVTNAAAADKVTAENTYAVKVSGKKATITLPYTYAISTTGVALVPTFTVSEGAAVYLNDSTNVGTEIKSGFYTAADVENAPSLTEDDPKSTFTNEHSGSGDTRTYIYTTVIVADETAKVMIEETGVAGNTVAIDDLKTGDYKGHVSIYTIEWKDADAKTGNTLKTFVGGKDDKITAKISSGKIELNVPSSYADDSTLHAATFTVSEMATLFAGSTKLVSETAVFTVDADGTVKFAADDNATPAATTELKVTSEAGETTVYNLTATVADAKTGADLTAITVGGVKGSISTSNKTATVTLPYGTDLTDVVVDFTVSDMATAATSVTGTEDDDEAVHYDLTDGMTIKVTSEDTATVNVYTVTVNTASQFSDVPADAYYSADVYTAAQAGIIKGYANGSFKPKGYITRADFAIMVTRMLKADVSGYTTTPFSDVSASHYAAKEIAYCAEKGIITGRGNGKFDPRGEISRQDAATIIARALELTSTSTTTSFKDDAKIASYAKSAVAACSAAKIIEGDTNGNFRPTDSIKRCDAAIIMVRALNK